MKAAIKKQWLKALRSGKYKQTRKTLRRRNGRFCCLGVLCDIQGAKWVHDKKWTYGIEDPDLDEDDFSLDCSWDGEAPEEYRGGMSFGDIEHLISMNDGNDLMRVKKHSFSEIADYIERSL